MVGDEEHSYSSPLPGPSLDIFSLKAKIVLPLFIKDSTNSNYNMQQPFAVTASQWS